MYYMSYGSDTQNIVNCPIVHLVFKLHNGI